MLEVYSVDYYDIDKPDDVATYIIFSKQEDAENYRDKQNKMLDDIKALASKEVPVLSNKSPCNFCNVRAKITKWTVN